MRMGALQLRERNAPNTSEESEPEERVCVRGGWGGLKVEEGVRGYKEAAEPTIWHAQGPSRVTA